MEEFDPEWKDGLDASNDMRASGDYLTLGWSVASPDPFDPLIKDRSKTNNQHRFFFYFNFCLF